MPFTPTATFGITSRSPPRMYSLRYWLRRFGSLGSVKPPRIADFVSLPRAASAAGSGTVLVGLKLKMRGCRSYENERMTRSIGISS